MMRATISFPVPDSPRKSTVERLRDDAYERERRAANAAHYFYSVAFDDGSFDTYVAQSELRELTRAA